jgi:hypothetical protein
MPTTISCPNCQKTLRLPENMLGKRVRCPGCQETFVAAAPEEEPVEPVEEEEGVQERPSQRSRPRRDEDGDRDRDRRRRRRNNEEDDDEIVRGRPHRGGTVLTLGILALVFAFCCPLVCWIVGGIGLSMAGADLGLMARRRMDRSGQGMTKAGQVLSIIGLVLGTINAIAGVFLRISGKF